MNLLDELNKVDKVFIDTAPIIYYIEKHLQFGPLVMEVVKAFQSGKVEAFTSAITLTEVLVKPIELGNIELAEKFAEFLKYGKNLTLVEITVDIAERAGKLRGYYPNIKTLDAIQISTAIYVSADLFITNDKKLKQIKEIKVIVLEDYLQNS